MKIMKAVGNTLLALLFIIGLLACCYFFHYIATNLTINYFFPYLTYHVFTALIYIIAMILYFNQSSKDFLSTVIGIAVSALFAYILYKGIINTNEFYNDSLVHFLYGFGIGFGVLYTVYSLYQRIKCKFSNNEK